MNVDDMVVMMSLLDADGDGRVTKAEFGVYYKRLKACSDELFEAMWSQIDTNSDGELTLNELCKYYSIDCGLCAKKLSTQKEMDDDKILEALQLQSLLNEARQKQEQQQRVHAERLRKLAIMVAEEEEDDEEDVSSPMTIKVTSPQQPTITMEEIIRDSKRRGDLAVHHYEGC